MLLQYGYIGPYENENKASPRYKPFVFPFFFFSLTFLFKPGESNCRLVFQFFLKKSNNNKRIKVSS